MHFTRPRVTKILEEIVTNEEGFNTVMKICIESLMKSERQIHNETDEDVSNGFRSRRVFGDKQMLELQVPRTRQGMSYPVILSLIKNQEQEARRIAFYLYSSRFKRFPSFGVDYFTLDCVSAILSCDSRTYYN